MDCRDVRLRLEREWRQLYARHAPYSHPGSPLWRFNRSLARTEPERGWKIHLSACVPDACDFFAKVAPILDASGVAYKIPRSLDELIRINSGIFYGYSQVGKFITVYPSGRRRFKQLATDLHDATRDFSSPRVPFDQRFAENSSVFYRYGEFKNGGMASADSDARYELAPPFSKTVQDETERRAESSKRGNKLEERYRVFKAIVQRGKGGVYLAADAFARPCRLVVLKEGRRHGETAWDGSDGAARTRNEMKVIRAIRQAGVDAPRIFDSFTLDENFYLVLEKIDGVRFDMLLKESSRSKSDSDKRSLAREIVKIISFMHAAGWVWRDCKPANFLATPSGCLRPIDFEGACRINEPQQLPWSTDGFAAPEAKGISAAGRSNLPEDLYSLGALLHWLWTGRPPGNGRGFDRKIPKALRSTIVALLDPDPARRPTAREVASILS